MNCTEQQRMDLWQESMELALLMYRLSRKMPENEQNFLGNRARHAAVELSSKVTEVVTYDADEPFQKTLSPALAALTEFEMVLLICDRMGLFTQKETAQLQKKDARVRPSLEEMLFSLDAKKPGK